MSINDNEDEEPSGDVAFMTVEDPEEGILSNENSNVNDVVVIGEGEDHRYCQFETSVQSSAVYRNSAASAVCSRYQEGPVKPPNVYVRHDRTWKFENTLLATCDGMNLFLYRADPFSPVPPFKGALSAVKRMEYAAQRIDNRKYKNQKSKALASKKLDSAACSKCKMRFFLPYRFFKNRISYWVPQNPYVLPIPRFRCPLCEEESELEV